MVAASVPQSWIKGFKYLFLGLNTNRDCGARNRYLRPFLFSTIDLYRAGLTASTADRFKSATGGIRS
jgi:hypothetical protein